MLRAFALEQPARVASLAAVVDRHLSRTIQKIHSEIDRPLDLNGLAHAAGMSRSSFAEHFRTTTGIAPISYVTRWRMLTAERYLEDPALSIPEIVERIGYESDVAFVRAFKCEQGQSPARFRCEAGAER